VDDALDVSAQLPANNPREELRGKAVTFHVKVKDIKQRLLPALDDELAKDVGNFETLVELRADIHTRLQKTLKDQSDTSVAEQIVDKLNEKNRLDLPPSLVEQQCRMMELEILQSARRMGQKPTQDDFQRIHHQVHADAEKKVRAGLLMAAIARKHGLQIGDKEIQAGIEELAAETGKNVAKVRAEYSDPQRRQVLIGMILEDKVLDLIESKATLHDGGPPARAATPTTSAQAKTEPVDRAEAAGESQQSSREAKKTEKAPEGESEEADGQ
jgi:trigger factor